MIVRHEINIINSPVTLNGIDNGSRFYFDPNKFSGTIVGFFEVLITTAGSSGYIIIRPSAGGSGIPIDSQQTGLVRSSAIDFGTAITEFTLSSSNNTNIGAVVKTARLIIIQDTGTDDLTASESQFEIGNYETGKTNTTAAALTAPKYWKYTAANWDGTVTAYAEAVYLVSNSMYGATITLQKTNNIAGNTGWTDVATIVNAGTATSTTRVRVAFTPEDGYTYRIAAYSANSMGGYGIYCAKIIVQQAWSREAVDSQLTIDGAVDLGSNGGFGSSYQSFTATEDWILDKIEINIAPFNNPNSDLVVSFYKDSLSSTAIETFYISSGNENTLTFSSPVSISQNQIFFLKFETASSAGTWRVSYSFSDLYSGGEFVCTLNTPYDTHFGDIYFKLFSTTNVLVNKLEEQYLLANTTLAAGTANQNFLTKYDPAEWDGVDVSFYHQVDASDNNTSVVDLRTTGGTQLSGSSVSSPDNQGTSGAVTMPYTVIDNVKVDAEFVNIGSNLVAQSFESTLSGTAKQIGIVLAKTIGNATGTFVIKLFPFIGTYGTSVSDVRNETPLYSYSYDISSITINSGFTYFDVDMILEANTRYILFIDRSDISIDSNGSLSIRLTTDNYSGSLARTNDPDTWNQDNGYDMGFHIRHYEATAQNIDVRATTNSGNIYASRIVVAITKTTTSPPAGFAYSWCYII